MDELTALVHSEDKLSIKVIFKKKGKYPENGIKRKFREIVIMKSTLFWVFFVIYTCICVLRRKIIS